MTDSPAQPTAATALGAIDKQCTDVVRQLSAKAVSAGRGCAVALHPMIVRYAEWT